MTKNIDIYLLAASEELRRMFHNGAPPSATEYTYFGNYASVIGVAHTEYWSEYNVVKLLNAGGRNQGDPHRAGLQAAQNAIAERMKTRIYNQDPIWRTLVDAVLDDKKKDTQESAASTLIRYGKEGYLFQDADGLAYAAFTINAHRECWHIDGAQYRLALIKRFYDENGKVPSKDALSNALDTLRAEALFCGRHHQVSCRVAGYNGHVYLDLVNEHWQVVQLRPDGWSIIEAADCPIFFRRNRGMLPLPLPSESNTKLSEIQGLINLANPDDWILVVGWLLGTLMPKGPYAGLLLTGPQGSAKSTATRFLRQLVDPNKLPARSTPADEGDLVLAARNGRITALDNLSYIPDWLSDAMARLATGGGISKRKLFSDDEEVLLDAQAPIIVNGITDIANRPDLVDRLICIDLKPIADEDRRSEAEYWATFEQRWPALLGALCSAVSMALERLPNIKPAKLPRMADFACWCEAAAGALDLQPGAFLEYYSANRDTSSQTLLESNPLAGLILDSYQTTGFSGSMNQLYADLRKCLPDPERPESWFPKTVAKFGQQLRRIQPELTRAGLQAELHRDKSGQKVTLKVTLSVRSTTEASSEAPESPEAALVVEPWHPMPQPSADAPPCPPDVDLERWSSLDWEHLKRTAMLTDLSAFRLHCQVHQVPPEVVMSHLRIY